MRTQAEANLAALIESTEDLIWSVDLDYRLMTFNRALRENIEKNYGTQVAVGMVPQDMLPVERAKLWPPLYERALKEGSFRTEYILVDGRTLEMAFSCIEVADKVTGISVFGKDITARKKAAEALQENEARFRWFFEQCGYVILLVDPARREVVDANRAAAQYYGYSREQLTGMNVSRINTLSAEGIAHEMQRAQSGECNSFSFRHRLASGEERDVEVSSSLVKEDRKSLLFSIVHDVTERKRAEAELRESSDFLREAQRIGDMGCYVLDIASETWTSTSPLDEILGIDESFERSVSGWGALAHPDDQAMMADYFANEVIGQGRPFDKQYRIIRQTDGAVRWVHGLGKLEFDAEGKPLKMRGIISDVTAHREWESQLQESEERYRATFEHAGVGIVHSALDGRFLRCNVRFAEIIGYPQEEVPGLNFQEITAPEDLSSCEEAHRQLLCGSVETYIIEKRFIRKNSSRVWTMVTVSSQRDGAGRIQYFIAFVEEIQARKEAEQRLAVTQEALRASEARYRTAFQTSIDSININRLDNGIYIDCNQAFLDTLGYTREEIIGRSSVDLGVWVDHRDRQTMTEMVRQDSSCRSMEVQFRKKNGELMWGEMSASLMDVDGVPCVLSITRDLSRTKAAENEIQSLAFYDPLTGLPNRRLLLERLHQAQAAEARRNHSQALLLIDLDNFKMLNDTLGHQTGDLLLQQVAQRLVSCASEAETVGRLGSDEFVVMLDDLSVVAEEAATQAEIIGEKLLASINLPYLLLERECRSTASIGITFFGGQRNNTEEILQQADIALHQAKAAGGNVMRFFSVALQNAVNARAQLEEDLRRAIKENQFQLYYQPQVERGRLTGAEALIRWQHPLRGMVQPNEFIPLAEESRLILPIGDWVLETACGQIALWAQRQQTNHLTVAVNISAVQFRQPEFVETVLNALDRSGANPKNLKLELTESMLVDNIEDVIAKMTALKSHGLSFSLDDFGTGYSSLAYLKRLPLDQLKIDCVFVHDMLVDATSGAIAQAVISLGRAMNLSVMAEGVETEEQRGFLTGLGCHSFQGFLFSPPLSLEDFEAFL